LIYGIDPEVALNVARIESNLNPNAIGVTNDIGLFQLRPQSFPQYTKKQLLNPELNVKLGIQYIAYVKKHCKHKEKYDYLACYNAGIKKASSFKYPRLFPYVKRFQLAMEMK
jgi:soluble lytic murein transglycosylase-like protein